MQIEENIYSFAGRDFAIYTAFDESISGKRPGVLVIHDLWGMGEQPKERARRLAELGYVGMAVDLFGDAALPRSIEEAMPLVERLRGDNAQFRDHLRTALAQLAAHPQVDATRLGAIGFCLGGIAVLEMARDGADLKAVVNFHGILETPAPAGKGDIKGSVLVCTGGADGVIPDSQIAAFQNEMRTADADWQVSVYGGAEHSFTNIYADRAGIPGVSYHKKADTRSWEAMRFQFAEAFA